MRRTPPIAKQVVDPERRSNALIQARLIDFDTGGAKLEEQHKAFLHAAISKARLNASYHFQIYGFASKLGDAQMNLNLSRARMQSVLEYIKFVDGKALNNLEFFDAFGEEYSQGGENDNSPEYRAVEVHVFIGDMPPIEPPSIRKIPKPKQLELPGGPRSGLWAVAAPGGATFTVGPSIGILTAGITGGFNLIFVKNKVTNEVRKYAALAGGLGASLGIPSSFKSLTNLLQTLATGPNFSNFSFTDVFPRHPVTFEEVESCLVSVIGGNAGTGLLSGSIAVFVFHCPGVMQFGSSGTPLKIAEDIWSFNSAGQNFQIGVGMNGVTGPLIRLS